MYYKIYTKKVGGNMTFNRIIKKLESMDKNKKCIGEFWKVFGVPIVKMEFKDLKINVITGTKDNDAMSVDEMIKFLKCFANRNWHECKKIVEFNNFCVFYFE